MKTRQKEKDRNNHENNPEPLIGFSEGLIGYFHASGITLSLAVFGKVESSYWENNPGSEKPNFKGR